MIISVSLICHFSLFWSNVEWDECVFIWTDKVQLFILHFNLSYSCDSIIVLIIWYIVYFVTIITRPWFLCSSCFYIVQPGKRESQNNLSEESIKSRTESGVSSFVSHLVSWKKRERNCCVLHRGTATFRAAGLGCERDSSYPEDRTLPQGFSIQ